MRWTSLVLDTPLFGLIHSDEQQPSRRLYVHMLWLGPLGGESCIHRRRASVLERVGMCVSSNA